MSRRIAPRDRNLGHGDDVFGGKFVTSATEQPHAPPRARIYFGWRIVLALFLCTLVLFGVSINSFIIFMQPIAKDFGWSQSQSGMLVSAMWLIAPLALFAGPVTARASPWRLVVAGLCIQAVALIILGHVAEFWQLYLLRIFMGLGKVMTASAAPLIVARWFSRRFATAVALVWSGGAAGGVLLSPLTEALCLSLGWRAATLVIAAGVLTVTAIAALLARGAASPAELGLGPDGLPRSELREPAGHEAAQPKVRPTATGWFQMRPALLIFLSVTAAGMTSIAAQAEQPAFLQAAGLSPQAAATVLGVTAAGALLGAASIGWMIDRFRGWLSGLVIGAAIYIGLLTLAVVQGSQGFAVACLGAICLGYGVGAGEVFWMTLTKRQFGEAAFPVTYGGWYFALQLGYALGGGAGGWALERLGGGGLLLLLGLLYLTPSIASVTMRAARRDPDG